MRLRLMIALELAPEDTSAQEPPPARSIVTTTGESVELKPLAKCGKVIAIETWRRDRKVDAR